MNKILLAIQFFEGDKKAAMDTARLIADLEPRKSEIADFLFVSRFDCNHDVDTIAYVSQKFNVHTFINRHRQGREWPHGCNDLWFGTVDFVYDHGRAKRIPDYKAVLTFEADACPLIPHWIERLSESWDAAKVKMLGAMQSNPGEHINGNCLISGDSEYLKLFGRTIGGCSPHAGWDYVLAPTFKKHGWADCPRMKSFWGCATMTVDWFNDLIQHDVVFLHGIKDSSVRDSVRKRFLSR